ncbi:helix-turn-helix transcriptional regulator [Bradyrhizobium sp. NBAIM08]|uniref:helix-turn-helix transcriptional regulator n=1 Tax=Bradyrhizobium sp. NBAIM08 TaxID=2793815 RepID=UPI001CD4C0AE|nr:LuxR C-terminal-related transcriptional regulator [Bradyrhizobium sp. NBAIM08]MCA1476158.1 helix-turn-helix transcriptional regulator [Bradyrhizobium sp. NBAIM08]
MHFDRLVDEIYEAAVVPERWKIVLDRLASLADAEGALLFAAAPGLPRWLSTDSIRSHIEAWVGSPFYLKNPRGERLVPIREPRFLTDLDAFTLEELEQEPFYTDFLRPRGLGWCIGTSIYSPAGDILVVSIEKAQEKGPVPREVADQLDYLRPHIARAALLSGRVGLERARASVESLKMTGLAAAVLGHGGKVLAANDALLAYEPDIRIGTSSQLEFSNPAAHAPFARASEGMSAYSHGASIPIRKTRTREAFVVHVLPMRGSGRDVFSGAEFLLYVTPVIQQPGPPPEILQALFDLSPAEARVAAMIAKGSSVDATAQALSVKPNTIRMQLKAIFAKTGTSRQAELVSLLRLAPSR